MLARPLLAALAVSAACADEPARAPAPAAHASRPASIHAGGPATLPAPPADPAIQIHLVSAGDEPRQLLRYRPRAGTVQTIALDSATDMAMTANGNRMFGQIGTTTGRVTLRIEKVEGERITVAVTIDELKAPTYDPTDFNKPESLANQTGTFVMSDRGQVLETNLPFIETSELAREAFELDDYLVLLPAEPVGHGARWDVQSKTQRNGLGIEAVDHIELVELAGAGCRTKSVLTQESWPQVVTSYVQDPVTVFELLTFRSAGSGDVKFSFDRPFPVESTTKFDFTSDMRIRRPDTTQDITMTFKADLHMGEARGANGRRP